MRTFIALSFDNDLKSRLGKIQIKLKENAMKGRWVYINNFHITLKFLGNIDPKRANEIKSVLGDIAKKNNKINLSLNKLGFFPGKDILRVVWVGMNGDMEALENLQKQVDWKMKDLGFPREKRKFTPHITLGREVVFNETFYKINEELYEEMNYSFTLDTIQLMKSEEISGKRIYSPLGTFKLK